LQDIKTSGLNVSRSSGLALTFLLLVPSGLLASSFLDDLGMTIGQVAEAATMPNADFNGDGYSDLAIGVTSEGAGTLDGAGAVNIIYGSSSGLSATALSQGNGRADQVWTQNSANIDGASESGDGFGSALATGDFNKDGYSDLAIGVPGEGVGAISGAGAVNIIYGSSSGLSATALSQGNGRADQVWTQNSANINDGCENGDTFGFALATGDFNKDGYSDLAIGVRGEDVGSIVNAGAVNIIYGSSSGLSATALSPGNGRADQVWTQNSANIEDASESGDGFGSALATGDFNKDGYSDLATGVPLEEVGTTIVAGAVHVIYGSSAGLSATALSPGNGRPAQLWSQNSAGIDDDSEFGDAFGSALATGDFNKDGSSDLAIGVPFEDVGANDEAGSVNVIYGSSSGLSATALSPGNGRADQVWTQNSANIDGASEFGDNFGHALAAGDFNKDGHSDLATGVPFEQAGSIAVAGAVSVIHGSSDGLSATALSQGNGRADQVWTQDSTGIDGAAEPNDLFGYSLA
jgi:hypothetical protein